MSIERRGQTVRFVCDDCGEQGDTGGMGFSDALATIKEDGWSVRQDEAMEWEHKCPDCRDGTPGSALAAARAMFKR